MHEPEDIPPPADNGPWWLRMVVLLSVLAALVITSATDTGVGIVLGVIALADTAGILVFTVVYAHRHKQSLRTAAGAVLRTEYGRWRMEQRPRRPGRGGR